MLSLSLKIHRLVKKNPKNNKFLFKISVIFFLFQYDYEFLFMIQE